MNLFEGILIRAKEIADSLVQAVERHSSDDIEKAVLSLEGVLDSLRFYRSYCSDNWADLINHMQGILKNIIRHKKYNKLKIRVATDIRCVIYVLPLINLTWDELERALKILMNAGLDPWIAIKKEKL